MLNISYSWKLVSLNIVKKFKSMLPNLPTRKQKLDKKQSIILPH